MSILANPLRLIFFFYLFYLYYSYVRSTPLDSNIRDTTLFISDNVLHFISFFILGALAQLSNSKENDFVFGISLALITSVFIEFIHFLLPYRDFKISEGIFNILGCGSAIYLISYLKSKYE